MTPPDAGTTASDGGAAAFTSVLTPAHPQLPTLTGRSDAGVVAPSDPADVPPRLWGDERRALICVAAVTAALPLLKPGGPSNLAPIDPLIVLALGMSMLWAGSRRQRLRLPYLLPIALFVLGGAVGALVGPVPTTGAIALTQDLLLACWCWAFFNISHTARNLRILLCTWIYSALAWGMILLVGIVMSAPMLTGVNERDGARVQLRFGDPSYAANYFVITMMLMWATQRPRRRWVRYTASTMFVVEIAFTGSNSGVVSLLVAAAVAAIAGVWRRFGVAPAVMTLTILIIAGGLVAKNVSLTTIQNQAHTSQYGFIRNGLGRGTSVDQRGQLLSESLNLFYTGSILGEGPASTKPRLIHNQATFAKYAHDDYLGALTERGFIGLAGVLLLVASLLVRAAGPVREKLRNGYEAVVVRPHALLGAVVGTLVAATVYGLLHNRHIWTLFAIVAAVSFWGRRYE
jgi:O-antigen ligase